MEALYKQLAEKKQEIVRLNETLETEKAAFTTRAKQRGVYKGRKWALSDSDVEEVQLKVASGEKKAKVARDYGIRRETLYTYLRLKN